MPVPARLLSFAREDRHLFSRPRLKNRSVDFHGITKSKLVQDLPKIALKRVRPVGRNGQRKLQSDL